MKKPHRYRKAARPAPPSPGPEIYVTYMCRHQNHTMCYALGGRPCACDCHATVTERREREEEV